MTITYWKPQSLSVLHFLIDGCSCRSAITIGTRQSPVGCHFGNTCSSAHAYAPMHEGLLKLFTRGAYTTEPKNCVDKFVKKHWGSLRRPQSLIICHNHGRYCQRSSPPRHSPDPKHNVLIQITIVCWINVDTRRDIHMHQTAPPTPHVSFKPYLREILGLLLFGGAGTQLYGDGKNILADRLGKAEECRPDDRESPLTAKVK